MVLEVFLCLLAKPAIRFSTKAFMVFSFFKAEEFATFAGHPAGVLSAVVRLMADNIPFVSTDHPAMFAAEGLYVFHITTCALL